MPIDLRYVAHQTISGNHATTQPATRPSAPAELRPNVSSRLRYAMPNRYPDFLRPPSASIMHELKKTLTHDRFRPESKEIELIIRKALWQNQLRPRSH